MDYPYETITYLARLSFRDAHGLDAVFDRYQRLRVLAPELATITQRVWGDGDPLHSFFSPSAELIDQRHEQGKHRLTLALNKPASRGDEIEIYSTWRIHHGFKDRHGAWEFGPSTPHASARVAIRFPIGREPEGVTVDASTGTGSPFVSRPGTKELILNIKSPAIGSLYRIDWDW
ncbi:MAG: hypothetical protein WEC75_09645 [Dehalococcoidia bacterium]